MSAAATIPLQIQQPQFASPAQQLGQALTLRQLATGNAIQQQVLQENALKVQEQQRNLSAQQALGTTIAAHTTKNPDGTFNIDHDGVVLGLSQAGYGPEALKYDADRRADLKTAADQLKASLDARAEGGKQLASIIGTIAPFPSAPPATNVPGAPPQAQPVDPAALAAYSKSLLNAGQEAKSRGLIDDQHLAWLTQAAANPTPELDSQIRQYGQMGLDHATQMTDARNKVNDLAENTLKLSQASEATSKVQEQQRALDASTLAAAARVSPDNYQKVLDAMPSGRARPFIEAGATDPTEILKVGMQPSQVASTEADANKLIEEKRFHDLTVGFEKGKLGVEQAKLALSNKEFLAKYGTPDTRSAFTNSVIQDPDSYFSLPPEMKPGVAADLVSRGLTVPVQLPSDLKSKAAAAGMTLAAIDRVRNLLNDPDIQGSIGPIAGRLGNLEQNIGDTIFGENDPRAQKEQQLRTELMYLKAQEVKGVIGGRFTPGLIKAMGDVNANPKQSQNLINGSLNGMENAVKAVGQEARAYSFGGASGAAPTATTPVRKVGDTVTLRNGKTVTVTAVHADGTFDAK